MSTPHDRVPRTLWVGLVAAAIYIAVAGYLGDVIGGLAGDDENLDFALGHFVPLSVLIVVGVVFARRAGWSRDVWVVPSVVEERRRWWMLAIPLLLAVQIVLQLMDVPWAERAVPLLLLFLSATLLVGLGEELYFRGIIRVAVRGHHGELVALLVTSVLFGIGHTVKFLFDGLPAGAMVFDIAFLAVDGALFYGALRATGTLWVPIVLHALSDFTKYATDDATDGVEAQTMGESPLAISVEWLLIVLAVALVVSFARADARTRRAEREARHPLESADAESS